MMNNQVRHLPLVSIIIPVYNAEPYLRRCLNSIAAQTYLDYEVIVVDDGSTDGSGVICDEQAARDARFVALHKENGGVSMARNLGLDIARGEYVMFVDADDWIEPKALEVAVERMHRSHADAVCMGYVRDNDTSDREPYCAEIKGVAEVKRWICAMTDGKAESSARGVNLTGPVAKLLRLELVGQMGLRFDRELLVAEDFWFNLCYFNGSNLIVLDNTVIYHYARTEGSLTRHYSDVRLRAGVVFMERLDYYWQRQMGGDESFRRAVCHQALVTIHTALNSYFVHPSNKDGFRRKRYELGRFLREPIIRRWIAELGWKDGQNRRELRNIALLKVHLYWLRLLTVPMKRQLKRVLVV